MAKTFEPHDQETLLALGRRIRDQRDRLQLRAADVAEQIGMSRSGLANIECGAQNPSYLQVVAIATALGVPVGYLAGEVSASRRTSKN